MEAIHHLYRTRAYDKGARALTLLTDAMVLSTLGEIKKLRRTLMKGRKEIINFFVYRTTNAQTLGTSSEEKAKE